VEHLADDDKRDFVGRIETILHQTESRLGLSDLDQVAQQPQDCNRDISELLDKFSTVRNASVRFVEPFSAQDLECTGVHPRIGIISVRELLHERLYHDLNHVKQVEGNTQRPLCGISWQTCRFFMRLESGATAFGVNP
jgi:hypothetical protein